MDGNFINWYNVCFYRYLVLELIEYEKKVTDPKSIIIKSEEEKIGTLNNTTENNRTGQNENKTQQKSTINN